MAGHAVVGKGEGFQCLRCLETAEEREGLAGECGGRPAGRLELAERQREAVSGSVARAYGVGGFPPETARES